MEKSTGTPGTSYCMGWSQDASWHSCQGWRTKAECMQGNHLQTTKSQLSVLCPTGKGRKSSLAVISQEHPHSPLLPYLPLSQGPRQTSFHPGSFGRIERKFFAEGYEELPPGFKKRNPVCTAACPSQVWSQSKVEPRLPPTPSSSWHAEHTMAFAPVLFCAASDTANGADSGGLLTPNLPESQVLCASTSRQLSLMPILCSRTQCVLPFFIYDGNWH